MYIVAVKSRPTSEYYFGPFGSAEEAYAFIKSNRAPKAEVKMLISRNSEACAHTMRIAR